MRLRTEQLTWREIDGETVLLDLRKSTYLRVNRSGTHVLQQLKEERSRDELVALLRERHDIPVAQAETDVDAFVAILRERDLLIE